jgi:hypothetical protein
VPGISETFIIPNELQMKTVKEVISEGTGKYLDK